MNDETLGGGAPEALSEQYVNEAVLFVVNWHAATVNMRLYPPSSSMVTDTVESARTHLEKLFESREAFSVSVLENSLLVDDVRLEEIEQQKAPVKSFVQWMNERMLTHLEFQKGVTSEEMTTLFEVLAAASDKDHRENLAEQLAELGVANVTINQRVYVAISAGEDYEDGIRKASPLDALKDELLMRYLMGKVDLGQVQDKELVDVLSDPGKVGGLLSTFISVEGSEGGVLVRSQKAEEALSTLSTMVDQVDDPSLRGMLSDQIGSIISEMTPREMTSMLTGESPENLNIRHVRERVITMLSDNQLLGMVDSLIDEYMEMKTESDDLETEWTKEKLRNLNELLIEVREDRGDAISEVIDHKLEVAGIEEERDPGTGRRVLSAYQLLGGPLEEEFVKLEGDIDQEITDQVRRLYAMEEDDLAAGMLTTLAENLKQESPAVRRFAAELVKETLESLEREYQLLASEVLEKTIVEDIRAEHDYAAYVPQVDSVAVIARRYMQEGMTERASEIVDLLKEQTDPEQDKGPELVKHAEAVVEMLTGPEGMIDMHALLLEDDEEKRLNTVRALAALGPGALVPLVDVVKDRGDIDLRDRALDALQSTGEVGVEALLGELNKKNPWYGYRNILNVVADLKLQQAVEPVGAMVVNPDERVRREALRSLARIGSRQSVPIVLSAANDSSLAVRRTAVRVLGMFGDSSVTQFLLDIINSQGPRGRDEDQAVMEAACLALGDLHDTNNIPQLTELLGKGGLFKKARPDEIRAAACIALGTIGDDKVVPVLERSMKDPSMMVRSSAEKALRKLSGGITAPEPISLEDEDEEEPGVVATAVQPEQEVYRPHRPPPHREAAPPPLLPGEPEQAPPGPQPQVMEAQPAAQEQPPFEETQLPELRSAEEAVVPESVEPYSLDVLQAPEEAPAPEPPALEEPVLRELQAMDEVGALEEELVPEAPALEEPVLRELRPVEEAPIFGEATITEEAPAIEPYSPEVLEAPDEAPVDATAVYLAPEEPVFLEAVAPEEPVVQELSPVEEAPIAEEALQAESTFEAGLEEETEANEAVEFEEEIAEDETAELEEKIELEEDIEAEETAGFDEAFEEPTEIEKLLKQEAAMEPEGAIELQETVAPDEDVELERPTEIELLLKQEVEAEPEKPTELLDTVELGEEVEAEPEKPIELLDTVDLEEPVDLEAEPATTEEPGLEHPGAETFETAMPTTPVEPESRAAPRLPAPPEWVEMPRPGDWAPVEEAVEPGEPAQTAEQSKFDQLEKMYMEAAGTDVDLELPAEETEGPPEPETSTIDKLLLETTPPAEPAPGAETGVQPAETEAPLQPETRVGPGQDVELPPEWRVPGEAAAPAPAMEPSVESGFLLGEEPATPVVEEAPPAEPSPSIEAVPAEEPPAPPEEPAARFETQEIPEEEEVFPEDLVEDNPPGAPAGEARGQNEFGPTTIEGFTDETAPAEAPEQAATQPPPPEKPSWMEPTQIPYSRRSPEDNPPAPPDEPPPPSRWK